MAEANVEKIAVKITEKVMNEFEWHGKTMREWAQKVDKLEAFRDWLNEERIEKQKDVELCDQLSDAAYYDGMTRAFEDVIKKLEEVMA